MTRAVTVQEANQREPGSPSETPWSKRVLPRTIRRLRVVAEQAIPGGELTLGPAGVSRLLIARFPAAVSEGLAAPFRCLAGLLQLRVFAAGPSTAWVLAAFDRPVGLTALADAGGAGADMFNLYAPYWRG